MSASVLSCGAMFDGVSPDVSGPVEISVRDGVIVEIGRSVARPDRAELVDLTDRCVSPGFIDTHVHLTMDASRLAQQTLESPAAKALKGLSLARQYLGYGFTTLRDLGCMDPQFPTVDLRDALATGLVRGPRLIVAGHIISASGGHGDLSGFYGSRWDLPVSTIADSAEALRRLVRREHANGCDWIKTANAGGYFSAGDDPARSTWFDDEMDSVCATARQLGMPVAVHTGAADACKQAIRSGARSLEHAYLIDAEGLEMAVRGGVYIVPTMQMTQEDLAELHAGSLPEQAVWKFVRDNQQILDAQRRLAASEREDRLRHRLRHVSVQPRHQGVPGDGRRRTDPASSHASCHVGSRRAARPRRPRRTEAWSGRRHRRDAGQSPRRPSTTSRRPRRSTSSCTPVRCTAVSRRSAWRPRPARPRPET